MIALAPWIALVAVAAAPAPTISSAEQTLERGIRQFKQLDHRAALDSFELTLLQRPTPAQRTSALLYAGLCRFELHDDLGGRLAFREALRLQPTASLPVDVSPKVASVFEEEARAARLVVAAAAAPPAQGERMAAVVPEPKLHRWVALGTAIAGVAVAAGGGAFGLAARSDSRIAHSADFAADRFRMHQSATGKARTANLLFATGGGLIAVGAGVYFVF